MTTYATSRIIQDMDITTSAERRTDTPEYRRSYERGWRSTCSLDVADRRGWSRDTAWMDGRGDAASGRPKWHRLLCQDHTPGRCELV